MFCALFQVLGANHVSNPRIKKLTPFYLWLLCQVREEYKRGFGVPTLIAVHPVNDPNDEGLALAKAYAAATGGDRAGKYSL